MARKKLIDPVDGTSGPLDRMRFSRHLSRAERSAARAAGGGRAVMARYHAWALGAILLVLVGSATAGAQNEGAADPATQQQTFLYFLFGGGGVVGVACTVPILFMSVAAMAMLVEHLITIRRSVLMPTGLAEEAHSQISNGAFPQAEQQCKLRPSVLSDVLLAGLQEARQGFAAVEKSMEDALQAQAARIFRKIEFLSVIANISTMLGLFGTVVGLVIAFKKVADTQGVARASDLAGGIYLALMTTVEGLTVAIPSIGAYALFKHRADQLIAETAVLAEFAFSGYKRDRLARRTVPEGIKAAKTGASG